MAQIYLFVEEILLHFDVCENDLYFVHPSNGDDHLVVISFTQYATIWGHNL